MPLQNRVTPESKIIVSPEYWGMFMGNRGLLHDDDRHLSRQVSSQRRWIVCQIEFRNRKRTLMTPGNYTELFFLDEATALAAGHRPCFECRRDAYKRFRKSSPFREPSADEMDKQLHVERLNPDKSQKRYVAKLMELPAGAMILYSPKAICLWWDDQLYRWSPTGYRKVQATPHTDSEVEVLTPRSTVLTMANGYRPIVHPTIS